MKIAYILDLFPVVSETFIVREILELERNGFNISIFPLKNTKGTQFSEIIHADTKALIPKVIYLPTLSKWNKVKKIICHLHFFSQRPVNYIRTLQFYYRHNRKTYSPFTQSVLLAMDLKKLGVDHIHAHFSLNACKVSMLASLLTDIPYSFTIHAHDIFVPDLSDLTEEKFKHAKFIASISNYNKKFILNKYPSIDSEKIKIVHCGIKIRNNQRPSNTSENSFIFISVGRLVPQKDFKSLIQACHILKRVEGIKFICKIIGEGEDRPLLEKMITDLELEDVIFLQGAEEQEEVIEKLQSADVFVLPCTVEKNGYMDGIPVALMEALAMEIPVITTNISGIPELIKEGAGILVEPENSKQLAAAMLRVYNLDDRERKEMITKGRTILTNDFNLTTEVEKLATFFSEPI